MNIFSANTTVLSGLPTFLKKVVARSRKVLRIQVSEDSEARAEKHSQAYSKSSLICSMLRMFFKRNEVDLVLNGFAADRL